MRPQTQDDIIEELRLILIQEGDDAAILDEARTALANWFTGHRPRVHLRLIRGSGRRSRSARQRPLLSSVEQPKTYGADR